MTFFSIVAALLVEQWRPLRAGNSIYIAFASYVNRLAHDFNAGRYRDGVISWMLALLPLALATLIISLVLHHTNGMLAFAWNVAVLYIALGFRQFSHFFNDILLALRNGDLARARQVLATWRGAPGAELASGEVVCLAIELGLIRSHRHVFGVMAWFAVCGPAGAIAYRLAALLNDRWNDSESGAADAFGTFAARAFEIMDWVPVRLTAIGFAVAGDFMGAVQCWREQASSWRPAAQGILLAAAAGALGVKLGGVVHDDLGIEDRPQLGSGDEPDVESMQAAVGLIWRALVLWLFLILLVTVAKVF